jgi:ATP-dependent Zn protease
VTDSFQIAQKIVRENTDSMAEMVSTLVEQETLTGVGLEAMLAGVRIYEGDLTLSER